MMQNLRVKISSCILIMIYFLLITGCSDRSYIRKAQCLPPPFPTIESLNPHEERYRQVDIDKPIQEILDYYLDLLTPVDAASSEAWINGTWSIHEEPSSVKLKLVHGTWSIQEEPSSAKRFHCSNSIDSYTGETGCIILHRTGEEETTIEYIWNLGEVPPGCASSLE
jgi:hypothetical protein